MEDLKPTVALAERMGDGMTVILWWVKDTLETYVTVDDARAGNFSVHPTPEGENANEVFYHPFAYHEMARKAPQIVLGEA